MKNCKNCEELQKKYETLSEFTRKFVFVIRDSNYSHKKYIEEGLILTKKELPRWEDVKGILNDKAVE